MRLTFLGTSAANAYPESFCLCRNCTQARLLGGPSLRRRSAALLNDDLLIDLGPDIHTACQAHGLSLAGVRYCLQTHAHDDHLDPSHLLSRSPEYDVVGAPLLHFYASPATLAQAAALLARDLAPAALDEPSAQARLNLVVHPLQAWQKIAVGPYEVTAVPAQHDPFVEPVLFAIQQDGQALFYATDTGAFPETTWQGLRSLGVTFDLVVLDHTYGPDENGTDHLSAAQVAEYAARLRQEGLLSPGGRVFATHIAHAGNPPHPQLAAHAAGHGYDVAYDGLSVLVNG